MDDIGRVDMPAILHYILDVTQEPKVGLIGHSMGSALFFIAAIENMELNEKIEFLVALGPSVINPGITSRIVRIVEPIKNYLHVNDCKRKLTSRAACDNRLCRSS